MNAKFSPSLNAIYPENMIEDGSYGDSLPSDLTELSEEETRSYWKVSPPDNKKLGSENGRPAWVDIPPRTAEELIAMAEQERSSLRAIADAEIAWRQDAVDVGIATDEETVALAAWKKYRVLLMRVDTAKPEWPTLPGEQAS
ncbi:TPA: tail fiber assembly protein [Citrobacter farmeri]|uniref:Tail assembly chaperone n=1 Tax=Citrobacter farmeri TaxID=67824 RepID=A0ACA8D7X3_9ENTR|nr:tail fiber assembly protein [Citrobacter farmeri]AST80237.1 tail assembly chaperone [Citrobacter farmeri]HAT2749918.1 tail fiber assembly protein [Citrobacter farmeri]HBI2996565.1 tail fiber assembly protein [Citrobacter farmeri]HBI2999288.1 tail fiber assembly protein [Citrobacter farmeri]HBI3007477.1 tail fiber assembly protein [Citrobacter farmeri]